MKHAVIMGGFGGQGIMMMGRLLAYAAMRDGLQSIWIPSYTPEMRHGVADCFVVVADGPIGELALGQVDTVIAMNDGALKRHQLAVRPEGKLLVDNSIVSLRPSRTDVEIIELPATRMADELGSALVANMVMLGAFVSLTGIVDFSTLQTALEEVLPPHRRSLLELNQLALSTGREWASQRQKSTSGGGE